MAFLNLIQYLIRKIIVHKVINIFNHMLLSSKHPLFFENIKLKWIIMNCCFLFSIKNY
jgi:hypothetical protein